MALDLTMTITADASQAKAELRSVEQSIKKVESASKDAESPVQGVVRALSGESKAAQDVVRSNEALEQATRKLTAAKGDWSKLTTEEFVMLGTAKRLNADLHGQLGQVEKAQLATAAASGLSRTAMIGLTAAIAGVVLVGAGIVRFLYDSAKAYVEQSGILEVHKEAIDGVKDAWSDMFVKVGAALLGSNADIRDFLGSVESTIRRTTDFIAGVVRSVREWIGTIKELRSMLPGFAGGTLESEPTRGLSTGANMLLSPLGLALPTDDDGINPQTALRDADGNETAAGRLWSNQRITQTTLDMRSGSFGRQSGAEALRIFEQSEREREQASRRAAAEIERHEQAIRKLIDAYTGADKIKSAAMTLEAVTKAAKEGIPIHKMAEDQQKVINTVMGEAIDVYRRNGQVAPEAMRLVWLSTMQAADGVKILALDFDTLGKKVDIASLAIQRLPDLPPAIRGIGPGTGMEVPGIPVDISDLNPYSDERLEKARRDQEKADREQIARLRELGGLLVEIGDKIPGFAGKFTTLAGHGVNAFAQMAEAAKQFGQGAVASLSATVSGFGAVLTFSQMVIDMINDITGKTARMQNIDQYSRTVNTYPGSTRPLRRLGFEADALLAGFDTVNVDDIDKITRAIEDQHDAMERYGLTWRDFDTEVAQSQINQFTRVAMDDFRRLTNAGADPRRVIQGMSGDLNQLIIDAVQTGTRIPEAMRPILEQLIRMGELSEDAARALLGLEIEGVPSLDAIREAADRYGLTLDDLGEKVKQIEIKETAAQIVDDWNLLVTTLGADAETVAKGMKDSVQKIVSDALRLGLEIPESMRPVIETLQRMGLLTDENGVKLENLDRIEWGKDLTTAIDELILKLDELIDKWNAVGSAAEAAGQRPNDTGESQGPAVPRPPDDPAPPTPPPPNEPPPPDTGVPPIGGRPGPSGHTGGYLYNGSVYPYLNSFHTGGYLGDEFPILAQSREYMMRRSAVTKYGLGFMEDVNHGKYNPRPASRHVTIPVRVEMPDGRVLAEVVARDTLE